jgi:hypothetical protein
MATGHPAHLQHRHGLRRVPHPMRMSFSTDLTGSNETEAIVDTVASLPM